MEPGYYWVVIKGEWHVAMFDGQTWFNIDYEGPIEPNYYDEIGPRIPEPASSFTDDAEANH